MTINPKLKIASGAVLVGGGIYEIKKSIKASDKKQKMLHGLIGAGLIISGILVGRKGVIQVIGVNNQGKAVAKVSDPATAIKADIQKESTDKKSQPKASTAEKDRVAPLAFNSSDKKSDSFDSIMKSTASNEMKVSQPTIQTHKSNIITAKKNGAVTGMGAKVVGKVDAKVLEHNSKKRQEVLSAISEKEKQHKKLIKASGWHAGLPLRNEISILKAQLFHY